MQDPRPSHAGQVELPYIYHPLPEGGYVRCLVLEPGIGAEPFRCTLVNAALPQAPALEAISCAWGSGQERASQILVSHNGSYQGTLRITANLSDVLHQVRQSDAQRILWADSVCISQADAEEKGKQVALMGDIHPGKLLADSDAGRRK